MIYRAKSHMLMSTRVLLHTQLTVAIMQTDTDVIIIGAGPAGLTAARKLSEHAIDYLLLSRESTPGKDKPCGGYLPLRAFTDLQIRPFNGCHPVRAVRMKFSGREVVQVDFDKAAGYNVARDSLGGHLLKLIDNHSKHVQMKSLVTAISIGGDGCTVTVRDNEGVRDLHSELVIDCSGTTPVSIKTSLVRERLSPTAMGYANQFYYEREASQESFEPVNEFYYGPEFSPHGYAWIFPRGHVAVVGTGGLASEVRRSEKRLTDYLNHLVNDTEPARTELAGATLVRRDAGLMPLAGIVRPSYSERIMLAGDAAAHCSPITGEGIHYSAIAGRLAAETAIEAVEDQDFSKKRLRSYEQAWTRAIGSDLRWGLWLQKRLMHGGSSEIGGSLLASKKTTRVIAEMILGNRSVRSAILAVAPSYLKSKLLRH